MTCSLNWSKRPTARRRATTCRSRAMPRNRAAATTTPMPTRRAGCRPEPGSAASDWANGRGSVMRAFMGLTLGNGVLGHSLPLGLEPADGVADIGAVGGGLVVAQAVDGLELQPSPLRLEGVGVAFGGGVGDDFILIGVDDVHGDGP